MPFEPVVCSLDGTLTIRLNLRTWVDFNIYHLGFYEAYLVDFLKQHLRAEGVFLDVGAYIGQYTLLAAKYLINGQVFAFEPHPVSAARLREGVELNRLSNVEVVEKAIGEREGFWEFYLDEVDPCQSSLSPHRKRGQVMLREVITLDGFCAARGLTRVGWLKIDVEGAEGLVLRGAVGLLERFRPLLVVEVSACDEIPFGDSPRGILTLLRRYGYRLYRLRYGRLIPLEPEEALEYENVIGFPEERW
jgi:FkbM family methyltransferase